MLYSAALLRSFVLVYIRKKVHLAWTMIEKSDLWTLSQTVPRI
jgi:hypothetical protein